MAQGAADNERDARRFERMRAERRRVERENAALVREVDRLRELVRSVKAAWQEALMTARFQHGAACNFQLHEGEGCSCGFGPLSDLIFEAASISPSQREENAGD